MTTKAKQECGFIWGQHNEHQCDAIDCLLGAELWLHSCECGEDIYEDKRTDE